MRINPLTNLVKSIDYLNLVSNKSRKHFLSSIVQGLISSRSVHFSSIAEGIDDETKVSSKERKIQDFFQKVSFDYPQLGLLLLSFVHHKSFILSIDRTEWDHGKTQINILCVMIQVGKMGVPIYFEMLDNKSGNSNYQDRIAILENIIKCIGTHKIDALVMDREFIGDKWLAWLKKQNIPFCVRVPKSHNIITDQGEKLKAESTISNCKTKSFKNAIVDNVVVNVSVSRDKKGELLYLIGSFKPSKLKQIYKKRWAIEVMFQAFKSRGFDMEKSRLRSLEKYRKLFAVVAIAYTLCWAVGIQISKQKPVKTKKHGYPQYSVFRRGINHIRQAFRKKQENQIQITIEQAIRRLLKIIG